MWNTSDEYSLLIGALLCIYNTLWQKTVKMHIAPPTEAFCVLKIHLDIIFWDFRVRKGK